MDHPALTFGLCEPSPLQGGDMVRHSGRRHIDCRSDRAGSHALRTRLHQKSKHPKTCIVGQRAQRLYRPEVSCQVYLLYFEKYGNIASSLYGQVVVSLKASATQCPLRYGRSQIAAIQQTAQKLPSQLIKQDGRLGFPLGQTVPIGTLANSVRRQRLFPGKCDFCGVWDCADQSQSVTDDRRSSVFRSELNTKMSAVAIAQTDNAPSKADLNTEFT